MFQSIILHLGNVGESMGGNFDKFVLNVFSSFVKQFFGLIITLPRSQPFLEMFKDCYGKSCNKIFIT